MTSHLWVHFAFFWLLQRGETDRDIFDVWNSSMINHINNMIRTLTKQHASSCAQKSFHSLQDYEGICPDATRVYDAALKHAPSGGDVGVSILF